MSSINISIPESPENTADTARHALIRRLAHAFSTILHTCGVEHSANVSTPTGGGEIEPTGALVYADGKLHTNTAHSASTPTNVHKP